MRRILFIGFGDTARRLAGLLAGRGRLYALIRSAEQTDAVRDLNVTPILGDLDTPESLDRLRGIADTVYHFAPPAGSGPTDCRTRQLVAALGKGRILPQTIVYISTTGVYGDCGGAWADETCPARPQSDRARRRHDAEQVLTRFARARRIRLVILRAPGIYGAQRLPVTRLTRGLPAVEAGQDSFSNHIHVEDLARIARAAAFRGRPGRIYNACDDAPLPMGEYFDKVADALGLPRPPRLPRDAAQAALSPLQWSFLRESRRLSNRRMHQELGVRLYYPSVDAFLARYVTGPCL